MKELTVKSLMVPLADYAVVSGEATLTEALDALEQAQAKFRQDTYRHRAVLVVDDAGQVVGKLSQNDVLMGLEPGYRNVQPLSGLSHWELSQEMIRSMMIDNKLWDRPLEDICRKAVRFKVRDIMYTPAGGEYVSQDASLDEAIHQLVMGRHQSLLVVQGERQVVGILRLTDVFNEVRKHIQACEL